MKLHQDVTDKKAIRRFENLEFEFNRVHNNFYDYSISIYKNSKSQFKYICPKHGSQETTASNHLKGKKCKFCASEKAGSYHKFNKGDFVEKAIIKHGNKYDYSKVDYINIHTPIEILCENHGSFKQSPNNHLKGHGCEQCAGVKLKTTEQFISESYEIHNNTYSYDKAVYEGNKSKIIIICKIHGEFMQYPNAHLKGHGCEQCSFKLISEVKRSTREQFVTQAIAVHGEKYDYSKVEYVNAKNNVVLICEQHGIFIQSPDSHVRGSGCPSCAEYGFNPDSPAILYYLKIKHEDAFYYKIGITNNNVNSRFKKNDLEKITDFIELAFDKGIDALQIEQSILKSHFKYIDAKQKILTDGNTEIFKIDVIDFELFKTNGMEFLLNYLQHI